jgi:hypothetical protein
MSALVVSCVISVLVVSFEISTRIRDTVCSQPSEINIPFVQRDIRCGGSDHIHTVTCPRFRD